MLLHSTDNYFFLEILLTSYQLNLLSREGISLKLRPIHSLSELFRFHFQTMQLHLETLVCLVKTLINCFAVFQFQHKFLFLDIQFLMRDTLYDDFTSDLIFFSSCRSPITSSIISCSELNWCYYSWLALRHSRSLLIPKFL